MVRLIVILLYLLASSLFAQEKKIKSFKPGAPVVSAMVDRANDFYFVLKTAEILKYDRNGKKVASFNAMTLPTSFDPTNAVHLLTYHREKQEYMWLPPSLENPGYSKLDSSWAIEPKLICPSGDFNLWILDGADWSLKKVDPRQSQVITEFTFSDFIVEPNVVMMKEYLGFLFVLDARKGIVVFNSLGKMIRQIDVKDLSSFNFLGEELYYLQKDVIHFFNLYTAEERTQQVHPGTVFVLLTDERKLTVSTANEVVITEYKP